MIVMVMGDDEEKVVKEERKENYCTVTGQLQL